MKAVVLHEYGGPSVLKYEDFPDPVPGPGEVLVRVVATSVNPIDWKMRSGAAKARFPIDFPAIIGRDVAGIVRSVGDGVTGFEPGNKVMALAVRTYAELVTIQATDLTLIPEGMEMTTAASIPLVTLTGEQLITRGTQVKAGQTILVTGAAGGVGRTAVWVARKAGATVIAGVRKHQLDLGKSLGADAVLALDDADAMETLGFVDAVADTVGYTTAQSLLAKVKPGGVFGSIMTPQPDMTLHPTVRLGYIRATPDPAALSTLAEDVLAGRLTIPIDRMVPLAEAASAHIAAEKGGIGKILLIP